MGTVNMRFPFFIRVINTFYNEEEVRINDGAVVRRES